MQEGKLGKIMMGSRAQLLGIQASKCARPCCSSSDRLAHSKGAFLWPADAECSCSSMPGAVMCCILVNVAR